MPSEFVNSPLNNGIRYNVEIKNHYYDKNVVIYEAQIIDLTFFYCYYLHFRFKKIQQLHSRLINSQNIKVQLPQLPNTNSLCFWRRTNNNLDKITDRKRQLKFYLIKILNNSKIQQTVVVKQFLMNLKQNYFVGSKSMISSSNEQEIIEKNRSYKSQPQIRIQKNIAKML